MNLRLLLSRAYDARRKIAVSFLIFVNIILIALFIMSVMSSCENKALCYHHNHYVKLKVQFDWQDAPEANPYGMTVYFYPEEQYLGENDEDIVYRTERFDLNALEGGEIRLPKGRYRVITYNNDTELAFGRYTDNFDVHHLFTRNASVTELADGLTVRADEAPRPDGTENENVVAQPDNVWGCHAYDVEVTEEGVSYRCFPFSEKDNWKEIPPTVTEHVITLYPHDLLCHYSYEVRNVKNLSIVNNACAAISGMSPTLTVSNEKSGDEPVTLPLEAKADGSSTIRGEFLTFGHPEDDSAPHRFGLYIWTHSGKSLFYGKDEERFDVTQQLDTATNRRRVHIIIDGLPLDTVKNEGGGGGFQPAFGDWNEEHADLIM